LIRTEEGRILRLLFTLSVAHYEGRGAGKCPSIAFSSSGKQIAAQTGLAAVVAIT
jgi:hypothetical protein